LGGAGERSRDQATPTIGDIVTDTEPRHAETTDTGIDSHDAQSAWSGGGSLPMGLSTTRIADANQGSQGKRHPGVWVAAWFGAVIVAIAALVLVLR
jgi:hypothetical protein